jgi:hypothetical protein
LYEANRKQRETARYVGLFLSAALIAVVGAGLILLPLWHWTR